MLICDSPCRYMKYPTFNLCWSLTSMQCVLLHASVAIKAKGSQDRYMVMSSPSSVKLLQRAPLLSMNLCWQKYAHTSYTELFQVQYVLVPVSSHVYFHVSRVLTLEKARCWTQMQESRQISKIQNKSKNRPRPCISGMSGYGRWMDGSKNSHRKKVHTTSYADD